MDEHAVGIVVILLAVAVVSVIVLQKAKLPPILGYLIVGVLTGPYLFGWLPDTADIHFIAEFGVVFLLFMLGLEFSLPKLMAMRRQVLGLGSLQFVITALLAAAGALAFGLSPAAAFLIAGVFAVSSTAIVIKLLGEQHELNELHGKQAVGVLLFQDLAVIPFLIIIPVLGSADVSELALTMEIATTLGLGVVAALSLFFGGRWVLRPVFRVIARTHSPELFTLAVLLTVISAAWLTHEIGLSYELGAFLAGLALSETQFKHQIESDIRPLRDILLALFFVTIGMMLNLAVLPDIIWPVLGLLIALLVFKALILVIINKIIGIDSPTGWRTGLVLAQGGEFGFILLAMADARILSNTEQQVILATVIFSMAITPLLVRYNAPIAKWLSAQKMAQPLRVPEQPGDSIREHAIIVGFGQIGQNISRVFESEQLAFTAIDNNPDLVHQAQDGGMPVFFGDGGNQDLLSAAGVNQAKALIITFEDQSTARRCISAAKQHNPDIAIVLRARSARYAEQMADAGASSIVIDHYEVSLGLSSYAFRLLGVPIKQLLEQQRRIRREHYAILKRTFASPHDPDDATLTELSLSNIVISDRDYACTRRLHELIVATGVDLDAINRAGVRDIHPDPDLELQANDVLTIYADPAMTDAAERWIWNGERDDQSQR